MQSLATWTRALRGRMRNLLPVGGSGRRVLRGASWVVVGNVVGSCSTMIGSFLVAKMLGAKHFGEFGIIQSTLGFVSLLAGPSLGLTATKHVAEFRSRDPERAARIAKLATVTTYALATAASATVLFGAPIIAKSILKAPHLTSGIRLASLALLFLCVNGVQVGVLTGFEAFREAALVNVVRGLLTLPAMWYGAREFGYIGVVGALVVLWGGSWAMSKFLIPRVARRHGVPTDGKGFWRERELLVSFSLPSWMGGLAVASANWVTSVILTRQHNGLEQMGVFNAIHQFFLVLSFLPGVINQTSLPILSERLGAGDKQGARRTTTHMIVANVLITVPLIAILAVLGQRILGQLGHIYAGDYPALLATLLTVPFYAQGCIASYVVAAAGSMWASFGASVLFFCIFVAAEYLLSSYGVMGLCTARLIAYVVYGACLLAMAYSLLRDSKRADRPIGETSVDA